MAKIKLHTGPGVFEVLSHVCRSPQEAMKQFVENAADAIEQGATEEGEILIKLTYETFGSNGSTVRLLRSIAVQDNGVGMNPAKMRQVLQQIGSSEKLNSALRGEQGIGLLAFALIAEELHLASTAEEGTPSSCLVLKRKWLKNGHAEIVKDCPFHKHTDRGTVAFLDGILPEIAPQLSRNTSDSSSPTTSAPACTRFRSRTITLSSRSIRSGSAASKSCPTTNRSSAPALPTSSYMCCPGR